MDSLFGTQLEVQVRYGDWKGHGAILVEGETREAWRFVADGSIRVLELTS